MTVSTQLTETHNLLLHILSSLSTHLSSVEVYSYYRVSHTILTSTLYKYIVIAYLERMDSSLKFGLYKCNCWSSSMKVSILRCGPMWPGMQG